MKRWLLTLPLLLLGLAGLVRADHVILVVNTGAPAAPADSAKTDTKTAPNPADLVTAVFESENLQQPFTKLQLEKFNQFSKYPAEALLRLPYTPLPVTWMAGSPSAPSKARKYSLRLSRLSGISLVSVWAMPSETNPKELRIPAGVHRLFEQKKGDTKNKTPPAELADWALTHGLVGQFVETMDKLAQDEKGHPAVAPYQHARRVVEAPLEREPATPWVKRLRDAGWKSRATEHYLLLHNVADKYKNELNSRLGRFEDAYRTFYYWFGMQNHSQLPCPTLPREKLLVVVAQNEDDEQFKALKALAEPAPDDHDDGWFLPREGIICLRLVSHEPNYEKLDAFATKTFEDSNNIVLANLKLLNKDVDGVLATKPTGVWTLPQQPPQPIDPWALALAVKVLKEDAERATVSHFAARQLAYASGLLPRYVVAPQWIQFGLGSFFETPLGAPWPSPASPSSLHLKPCQELLDKTPDKDVVEILKQTVADDFFRQAAAAGDADRAAALARARDTSWALTYFLVRKRPDRLKAYCDELNRLPRDLDFGPDALLACFARAVGAVDGKQNVDTKKLADFAGEWKQFLKEVPNDTAGLSEAVAEAIKTFQAASAGGMR